MLRLLPQQEGILLMCSCKRKATPSTAEHVLRAAGVLGCLQIRWGWVPVQLHLKGSPMHS